MGLAWLWLSCDVLSWLAVVDRVTRFSNARRDRQVAASALVSAGATRSVPNSRHPSKVCGWLADHVRRITCRGLRKRPPLLSRRRPGRPLGQSRWRHGLGAPTLHMLVSNCVCLDRRAPDTAAGWLRGCQPRSARHGGSLIRNDSANWMDRRPYVQCPSLPANGKAASISASRQWQRRPP